MPRVDLGNGYFADFPDTMPREEIEAALRKQFPPADSRAQAANPMATERRGPGPSLAESATAFAEGVGKGAFNVGGIVGERVAPGYETRRAARAEKDPVSSGAGYLAGAMGGGGVAGTLARRIPGMAITAGQFGRNLLRVGAEGAATGAAQAAAEGEDAASGAQTGALGGSAATLAGKGVTAAVRGVKSLMARSGRSAAAMRALGKRFNMQPDELDAALDNFAAQYGRQASLSDIADLETKGALKDFAAQPKNRTFAAEIGREVQRRETMPPAAVTRNPNQPMDPNSAIAWRDKRMDDAMRPLANSPVRLTRREIDSIMQPDVYESLSQSMKRKINAVKGGTARLTIRDADNLRQHFAAKAGAGEKMRFGEYAKDIESVAVRSDPRYAATLDQYRKDSNAVDAFSHGYKGGAQKEATDPALRAALASPEGTEAYALGLAERNAAQNLSDIVPSSLRPPKGMSKTQLANLGIAAAKPGALYALYHAVVGLLGLKIPDKTQWLAARYLADPKMAKQGVTLLRKGGATDEMIAQVLAAGGGAAVGGEAQ